MEAVTLRSPYATWQELSLRFLHERLSMTEGEWQPYLVSLRLIEDESIEAVELVSARNELEAAFWAHTNRNSPDAWQVWDIQEAAA